MSDKSKLNMKTYFGEDLHDYPESSEDLKKFIEFEKQQILNLIGDEKYKRISRLAVHYRQLRIYDEAHELFKTASRYFENTNPQMEMVNNLRWSDVFRYENRFDDARSMLKKAEHIILTHQLMDYQDFYFQHLGKLLFDKCEYEKALEYFDKALALRTKKANSELILSTEFALKITKQKLGIV